MRALVPAFLCVVFVSCAQEYPLGPDSQPQANVPHGTVTRLVLPPGKFYPGTPHNYQIYVPAQYNAAKPAPFMIFLDGNGPTVVLDNLIAKGELPPLIGIYIAPGAQPALSDSIQGRRERTFEYDNISSRFSSFLEQEVIPEVAKKYNLSKNPDDHAIEGVSTGAVGAFIAAWQRPDMFHRVLSFIGTYVDMRGADTLPAMIRREEPKPIRIFLQDGRNDHLVPGQPYGTFYGGSWPINNEVMYEAFQFAGYDAKLTIGEGGHDMKQGNAIMPDALRWLWREYPKPILAGTPAAMNEKGWDPRGQVYGVLLPGKPWQAVSGAYQSVSSPAADKNGDVYFADSVAGRIYKTNPDDKTSVFRENTGGANLIRFGEKGLYAFQPGRKRLVMWSEDGKESVVATPVSLTDFVVNAKNEIYYIASSDNSIVVIGANGQRRPAYRGGEVGKPAALTLSPDQGYMEVGDAQSRFNWSFQIGPEGTLDNGEPYFRVDIPEGASVGGVTSATVDSIGQVYWATSLGIQFCEQNGRCAAILGKPERGTLGQIAFGGKDLNWLYAVEGDKLWRRETKAKGVAARSPVKPPNPPL